MKQCIIPLNSLIFLDIFAFKKYFAPHIMKNPYNYIQNYRFEVVCFQFYPSFMGKFQQILNAYCKFDNIPALIDQK
jgi:hypothetical protein